jgi:3-methyladenine DNA glycosylase AlkD
MMPGECTLLPRLANLELSMHSPASPSSVRKRAAISLLLDLRQEFRCVADPSRAPEMQRYMKSAMPYHGVRVPAVRKICKKLFAEVNFASHEDWHKKVLQLWRRAQYREERYAAIALTGVKRAAPFQIPRELPLYEEMIVTGAWWDFVDEIASRRIGPILRAYPSVMRKKMLAWSNSDNLWKRRASILCQLSFKQDTDLDLLFVCIEPSLDSKEFFLQKAIGWALRQYAWTNPDEVRRYVQTHKEQLSSLSRREALKNI